MLHCHKLKNQFSHIYLLSDERDELSSIKFFLNCFNFISLFCIVLFDLNTLLSLSNCDVIYRAEFAIKKTFLLDFRISFLCVTNQQEIGLLYPIKIFLGDYTTDF